VSSISLFLNKTEIAIDILERNTEKAIGTKINQDGFQPYEIKRSISLDYHIYNLQAFFNLAKVGDNIGIDLWHHESSEGSGLNRAIDLFATLCFRDTTMALPARGTNTFIQVCRFIVPSKQTLRTKYNLQRGLQIYPLG